MWMNQDENSLEGEKKVKKNYKLAVQQNMKN